MQVLPSLLGCKGSKGSIAASKKNQGGKWQSAVGRELLSLAQPASWLIPVVESISGILP